MKKFIVLALASSMIVSLSAPAFAVQNANCSVINDKYKVNEVESEYLPNVILVENGIPRQITREEYDRITTENREVSFNQPEISPYAITFDRYTASSSREYLDRSKKKAVTPAVKGDPNNGTTISYGNSISFSASYSISLTSGEISTILSSVGGSYVKSASSNSNFGATFHVPANQIRRVYFTPYVLETKGKLQKYVQNESEANPRPQGSPKSVTAKFIKKVGSFADGLYELGS